MRKKLKDSFPDLEFGTAKECLDMLNWNYIEVENRYNNVVCDCGTDVIFGGWIGTEYGYCPNCAKGMQLMTGFLPASNVTAGMIKCEEYDLSDGRRWTPNNLWGFKGE